MNEWLEKYDPAWAGGSCEWCGAADGVACEADCPDILALLGKPHTKRYPLREYSADALVMLHGVDVTADAYAVVTYTETTCQVTIQLPEAS